MSNKEDWNEIENWDKEQKAKKAALYSTDFSDLKDEKSIGNINKINKVISVSGLVIKIICVLSFIFISFFLGFLLYINYQNIKLQVDVDPEETIEAQYGIKVKLLDQQIDENKNGKYFFQVQDKTGIKFTAIKNFGSLVEDYPQRELKYYFDKWDSNSKNSFTVNEKIEDDILYCDIYIENYNNIDDATDKFIEFVNYCDGNYKLWWHIYIKTPNKVIFPYSSDNMTREEVIENVRNQVGE